MDSVCALRQRRQQHPNSIGYHIICTWQSSKNVIPWDRYGEEARRGLCTLTRNINRVSVNGDERAATLQSLIYAVIDTFAMFLLVPGTSFIRTTKRVYEREEDRYSRGHCTLPGYRRSCKRPGQEEYPASLSLTLWFTRITALWFLRRERGNVRKSATGSGCMPPRTG